MLLQSQNLSMLGLGIEGNPDVIDGNHLRWFFDPTLGFPKYGFELYRRFHQDCTNQRRAIGFGSVATGEYASPYSIGEIGLRTDNCVIFASMAGTTGILLKHHFLPKHHYLEIVFPKVVKSVNLRLLVSEEMQITIVYKLNDEAIYRRVEQLTVGRQTLEIHADGIDSIRLILGANVLLPPPVLLRKLAILEKVSWIMVSDCDEGWGKIADLCLPITHADYPCRHETRSDWEVAKSRLTVREQGNYDQTTFEEELKPYLSELIQQMPRTLPQSARTRDASFHVRLEDADGDLEEALNRGELPKRVRHEFARNGVFLSRDATVTGDRRGWVIVDQSQRYAIQKVGRTLQAYTKTLSLNPLELLLLAALEPGIARMLGLYYVDTAIEVGRAYDYKIIGRWVPRNAGDLLAIDFSQGKIPNPIGKFFLTIQANGFVFSSDELLRLNPDNSLRVGRNLRIRFPRHMSRVLLVFSEPVRTLIHKGDGSSELRDGERCEFHEIRHGIVSLEILGDTFDLRSLQYGDMDYGYVVSNITQAVRPLSPPPRGLRSYRLLGKSIVNPQDRGDSLYVPATVGLKWNFPNIVTLNSDRPVFYQIERQPLGRGEHPESINPTAYQPLNDGKPILVPRLPHTGEGTEAREIPEFPPEWPIQTNAEKAQGIMPLFCIDSGDTDKSGTLVNPLEQDTWYAYRILGIDIFGRYSEPSLPAPWVGVGGGRLHNFAIQVADTYPPPPPLVVSAKYLDPDDPYLKDTERDLTADGEKGIQVVWKWPERFQSQVPDAEKFRIYVKSGLLNVLEGRISSVSCFEPTEHKGCHLKGSLVVDDSIKISTTLDFGISVNTSEPRDRFFKYDHNFFPIVEILGAVTGVSSEDPSFGLIVDFRVNNQIEFQRNTPIVVVIPQAGIKLSGTIHRVVSNSEIRVRIPMQVKVKLPDNSAIQKFIRYDGKRLKVMEILSSTWHPFAGYLAMTLRVENPIQIAATEETGKSGIFDVDYSKVDVDFDGSLQIPENAFAGEALRQRGKNFVIIQHTASMPVTDASGNVLTRVRFTVQNLTLPPREIPTAIRPATLLLSPENSLHIDYSNSQNWVTPDWVNIEVDLAEGIDREEPVRDKQGNLILEQTGEPKTIRYKLFSQFIPDRTLPETCRLRPTPQEPMVSGFVGITTVDRSGNESSVSPSQQIFTVLRETPPSPATPDIAGHWATIPDYYGQSHFEVTWPVTEGHRAYFHQVYRTMEQTLMLVDRQQHPSGEHRLTADLPSEVRAEIEHLDGQLYGFQLVAANRKRRRLAALQTTYLDLRNDTWQYLASLPENAQAFSPVSKPLDPQNANNWQGEQMIYVDSLEGKGRNRYFYRMVSMDKAGNRSAELSSATPPVRVPDVIPPTPPVITKVLGGDRTATLRWRRNTEPGLVSYQLYRTEQREAAADVGLMGNPYAAIQADAAAGTPLRAQVIQRDVGYADVSFPHGAHGIERIDVYEIDEVGERISDENYFGGFKSLTAKVSIDEGEIEVEYQDMAGHVDVLRSIPNVSPARPLRVTGGQVKVAIDNGSNPIAAIRRIQKTGGSSDNLFEGVSSGIIVLRAEVLASLGDTRGRRDKRLAVQYVDSNGTPQVVDRIPYEFEFRDEDLEAGTYYYRLVAVRAGVIGTAEDGSRQTVTLLSHPSKLMPVKVFDLSPPQPPRWERVEWVKLDEDGDEHAWTEDVEPYRPAVVLAWSTHQPGIKCIVQRRLADREFWSPVSKWLQAETYRESDRRWVWRYRDKTVKEGNQYVYKIRLVNTSGKTNFSEDTPPV